MAKKKKRNQQKQSGKPITVESVQALLDKGKASQALTDAKMLMKQEATPAAEEILAKAYYARIEQLNDTGLVEEAQSLVKVAQQKCPHHKDDFSAMHVFLFHHPLTQEDVENLVALYETPQLSEQKKKQLEMKIVTGLTDPRLFLNSKSIPVTNPLRQEAEIVWEGLRAASEDMPDEERKERITRLAKVPRRSPFAPWVLFVRALHAFYQEDLETMVSMLRRIPDTNSLGVAKCFLLEKRKKVGHPEGLSSKATRDLWRATSKESHQQKMHEIMSAISYGNNSGVKLKIKELFELEPFTRPIAQRMVFQDMIFAMTCEEWEFFQILNLLMPYYEKWYEQKAIIILNLDFITRSLFATDDFIDDDVMLLMDDMIKFAENCFSRQELAVLYAGLALNVKKIEERCQKSFSYFATSNQKSYPETIRFLELACVKDPCSEYYAELVRLYRLEKRPWQKIEPVLLKWKSNNPHDCEPIIQLLDEAEKRGALVKAMNYLKDAETIDRINQKVRTARYNLTWKQLLKHLRQKKFHLAQKDLKQVMGQEMTPLKKAIFDGAAAFTAFCEGEPSPVPLDLNPAFYSLLFWHIHNSSGLKMTAKLKKEYPLPTINTEPLLNAYFMLQDALDTFQEVLTLPKEWENKLPKAIASIPKISESSLVKLLRNNHCRLNNNLKMDITKRGIKRAGSHLQDFLYYRAELLMDYGYWEDSHDAVLASLHLCKERGDFEGQKRCRDFILNEIFPEYRSPFDYDPIDTEDMFETEAEYAAETIEYEKRRKAKSIFINNEDNFDSDQAELEILKSMLNQLSSPKKKSKSRTSSQNKTTNKKEDKSNQKQKSEVDDQQPTFWDDF